MGYVPKGYQDRSTSHGLVRRSRTGICTNLSLLSELRRGTFKAAMDKICPGKWRICMAVMFLGTTLLAVVTAQPVGFLSIDCGGKENHTDENNITWVIDDNYIDVGQTTEIGDPVLLGSGSYSQNLRFFPKPLNKSCYQVPVTPDVPYLLRLWFAVGNSSAFQQLPSFSYSIETIGMLYTQNFTTTKRYTSDNFEGIFVSSGTLLCICLIRTSETDNPFINAIELRTLKEGMYAEAKPGTMLISGQRIDFGGNYTVRYPQDNFDRLWLSELNRENIHRVWRVSTQEPISTNNTKDLPPMIVMQTALVFEPWVTTLSSSSQGTKSLLVLYFAEMEILNLSESRSFYISINNERRSKNINLIRNYSAVELTFLTNKEPNIEIVKAKNSTLLAIINAYEYYHLVDTEPATYSQDIETLAVIKTRFNMKNWISDPCYLIQWEGIGCDNTSSRVRISQINLSGRNLKIPIPEEIGHLTALVNVSLENNHLMGPLPNLSNLTLLQRLYLQNNSLSGSVPDWLSELKNLKELFIQNNNFTGVIPAQLLLNRSLNLIRSGNPYLCMHKGECILPNSNKNKMRVVLGITLGGILIIAVALIVGIVVYRKKFRRKEGVTAKSSDYSMTMLLKAAKSRAFTLDELKVATKNFSKKIGEGGFGSVFFGTLQEGQDIAVKVLSLFSKQGAQEFINEVDLLSRVNHRNLVSLLGYCNESRELMLVYEHMSGGSLKDHLYGFSPGINPLNWKTRVKIVLDAAQGLEYLHQGCRPRIIHRDVKTANILLDNNMNGKLADFGLSRMTVDGEDSHVTTTVKGTAGYLDPEYFNTQMLTEKSDVYSFGVVLLEIICGRKPIDLRVEEVNLIRWATPYVERAGNSPDLMAEIIDKRLEGNYYMESITRVAKVAIICVHAEPSSRPSASEVVTELKEAAKLHEDNASISIPGGNGIESKDLQASPIMDWGDDSSNILKVGR